MRIQTTRYINQEKKQRPILGNSVNPQILPSTGKIYLKKTPSPNRPKDKITAIPDSTGLAHKDWIFSNLIGRRSKP